MAKIDQLLRFMVKAGASDLHLSSNCLPKLRIDGEMRSVSSEKSEELTPSQVHGLLEEIVPDRNKEEFDNTRDTDFAYAIDDIGRFRVNVFNDLQGTGAVFRFIPQQIMSLEELNMPPIFKELCALSKGLVLVTGPTGSGKSTTLAAMVDYVNRQRQDHIVTIEDPVEFVHQNNRCLINQREVKTHTDSFQKALRAALRQDPDIILVGELRDLETTEIAIETAETGHLVFGTLHTSTAASTVDRIIDQFPVGGQAQIRTMLASSLKGVICQNLLKRIGKGRVAAMEILVVNAAVANNIREGKTHQIPSAIQTGKRLGMRLLNSHLIELVQDKIVAPEEAYLKAADKDDIAAKLRSAGFAIKVE
ncbi:MAG: type IV pilus twitching motility protein PilT [Desulfofustis sp.]|nr:type IV pilus twitching motility protein PilT [Desulfofustis sp.]MBT8347428.1 type IV pilus twitching motility protein PilT [Desulfofustis sp.]RZW19428.1 MAG: type IV pilus twitching motility protein PilT [Desulfobulbaceae bacterium]